MDLQIPTCETYTVHTHVNTHSQCSPPPLPSLSLPLTLQLSLSDGSLTTAATYLIIIQNLEAATVSRQVRLL